MHFIITLALGIGAINAFALFSQILSLLSIIFCIWMLIDCILNRNLEHTKKGIWLLVIFLIQPFMGALIYFFICRFPFLSHKKRLKQDYYSDSDMQEIYHSEPMPPPNQ